MLSKSECAQFVNATILITGCAGSIGYYLMHFFEKHGESLGVKSVIAIDNFILGKPDWLKDIQKNTLFSIHKFDIVTDNLSSISNSANVDYVLHMASIASPIFYRKHPIETVDANIWGLRRLLDFYVNKPIKGFLFFSSSEIYGDPSSANIPTDEEYRGYVSAVGPRACYDEAKRFGETLCTLFSQQHRMPITIVRPFNTFGPGMKINDKRVVADFAEDVITSKNIDILSNGAPTRTYCYVSDALAGYIKVLLHAGFDYFNIGADRPEITVAQLAEIYLSAAQKIFNYSGKINYKKSEDKDYLTDNPNRRCPDISKAKRILGYAPKILVEEGVERFLRFIKESPESEYKW